MSIIAARRKIFSYAQDLSGEVGIGSRIIYRDIVEAKKVNRISLDEYRWTGYYSLNEEQKQTVSTMWTRAQFRKTFTDRRYKCILMDKYIFSRVFSEFFCRECVRAQDVVPSLLYRMGGEAGKVVLKPNCKGQGRGVKILPVSNEGEVSAAMDEIKRISNGIVEEFIVQHDTFAKLNPNAVNIVRFYSISSPVGSYLFAPVLTVAVDKKISNGSQDALTAMVDINNGVVMTDAVDQNNNVDYATHPVTGVLFKGLRLPYWSETIEMMRRAVPLASKISNIGWDVAVTPAGPLIIEANTIPGFNTAQYRGFGYITQNHFYQPLFEEGMKGTPIALPEYFDRVVMKLR